MNIRRGFEDALSRALARQREIVGAPAARPDDSRSEILERRLDKLKRELLEMEIALERMASEKGIDPGLASIYREVQGLNQLDTHYEKKKGVLKGIFEANLKLQTPG